MDSSVRLFVASQGLLQAECHLQGSPQEVEVAAPWAWASAAS